MIELSLIGNIFVENSLKTRPPYRQSTDLLATLHSGSTDVVLRGLQLKIDAKRKMEKQTISETP